MHGHGGAGDQHPANAGSDGQLCAAVHAERERRDRWEGDRRNDDHGGHDRQLDGGLRHAAERNHRSERRAQSDRGYGAIGLPLQGLDGNSAYLDERLRNQRDVHADGGLGHWRAGHVLAHGQLRAVLHGQREGRHGIRECVHDAFQRARGVWRGGGHVRGDGGDELLLLWLGCDLWGIGAASQLRGVR